MSWKNHSNNKFNRILVVNWVQYKLNRIIEATATNLHHIMWKCNKMKYNVNIPENIVEMNEREHVALNNFFKDKQNPREQLQKLFEIVKPVLSPWVRNELYTILYQTDDEMFYIQELLKWKQKQKKKKNQESDENLKK